MTRTEPPRKIYVRRSVGHQWVCPNCWRCGDMHYGPGSKASAIADIEDHRCGSQ